MATYAPKITREEGLIDWSLPAASVHNRVRGLCPWPHAFTFLEGARMIVLKTRVEQAPATATPGTVVAVAGDALHVATGDGLIAIEELQPEGKRAMRVRDYLAGRPLAPGARFTGPAAASGPAAARKEAGHQGDA
jgi:methionyl-tRNA formyltransferase